MKMQKLTRGLAASLLAATVTAAQGEAFTDKATYLVIDLSGGAEAASYPVRYTSEPPDLSGDTCRTTEMWLRQIPAGTFMMGSPENEFGRERGGSNGKEDLHSVKLTKPFYMGVFEVTQKQWELVMGTNPSSFLKRDEEDDEERYSWKWRQEMGIGIYTDTHPVETVSYEMIRGDVNGAMWPLADRVDRNSFFGKLRAKTSLVADLPTEAQWEYACRAGTTTALNNGKDLTAPKSSPYICPNLAEVGLYDRNKIFDDVNIANIIEKLFKDRNTKDPFERNRINAEKDVLKGHFKNMPLEHTKVGMYKPNAWGLYDMHGNVGEWCLDYFEGSLGISDVVDPKGAKGGERVVRGGSFSGLGGNATANLCRSAARGGSQAAEYKKPDIGFRIVVLPSP